MGLVISTLVTLLVTLIVTLLVTLITPVAMLYYFWPRLLTSTFKRLNTYFSGQRVKSVILDDGCEMFYGERGQPSFSRGKPTLVFIHGYSGTSYSWTDVVKRLPRDLHIINMDLPGHGLSTCIPETDLSIQGLTKRLRQFVEAVGLCNQGIHFIGRSMGATVAGCYSAAHPEHVMFVTMISPVVRTPELSRMNKEYEETGKTCLTDSSFEGFCEGLRMGLNVEVIPYPTQILKGNCDEKRPYFKYWVPLFESMTRDVWLEEEDLCMGRVVKNILAPTQLIWGQIDQFVHVSGAESLKKDLPNCRRVHIIKDKGHSVPHGMAAETAAMVMDFQETELRNSKPGNGCLGNGRQKD